MKEESKFVELEEICEFQRGLTVSADKQFKENIEDRLLPIIKIGNVQETRIVAENLSWIDPCQFSNVDDFWLLEGEIVIAMSGNTSGKIGCNDSKNKYIFYSAFCKLKPFLDLVDQKYLLYALLNRQKHLNFCVKVGTQPNLDLNKVKKLKIPLPSLKRQEKIANWLDTFTSLERQLERHKKRYQYYLNKLTRGGQLVSLKEIVRDHYKGTLITKSQITTEGTPCIRYGEIYKTYNIWFDKPISYIQLEEGKRYKYCEKGDLLVTDVGESLAEIAKPLAYLGNIPVIIDEPIISIKHNQNVKYLSYSLSSQKVKEQKQRIFISGPTVKNISCQQFLKLKINLPNLDEQNKIANWLDKFRELTDQSTGKLSREILLLKQQSKYYSNKLIN